MLKIFFLPFRALGAIGLFLFKKNILARTEGARLAKPSDYTDRLSPRNTGLLLDGDTLKIGERESFQNVCVIARVGAGKTSRYIIPNVIERAAYPCSLVVNDPKGEVYEATSGYMKSKGFRVIVIDPEHPESSAGFNPLTEAQSDIELDQIAEILIKAGKGGGSSQGASGGGGSGDFWASGAVRFVSVFLGCLRNAGRDNPAFNTLANLYYLFQNFGDDGSRLDGFMARYSVDPDHPSDRRLWNEWQGVLTGNKEGVQSFVLNAITALSAMRQANLARVTAESSFSLASMRETKTIFYFITPPQHAEYYGFLTSLFFRSVFNACMREQPPKEKYPRTPYLSVYVLYDEFGHSSIPSFVSTANTIRGYRVSLSIVLQSIAQLSARYGRDYAQSIQGGFGTQIAYAGSDPETASFFERIIGRTRHYQYQDPTAGGGHSATSHMENYREQNLMNANEIRTMKDDEVLIVSGNKDAILIRSRAYWQVWRMKRATDTRRYPPAERETGSRRGMKFVSLD